MTTDYQMLAVKIVPEEPNSNADIGMSVCVVLTVSMSFYILTCEYIFSASITPTQNASFLTTK